MAIESSANDISQLNQNFPTAEDFVSEGDDHIRLIKKAVKSTFYKIKGVCGISHHQLTTLGSALKDVTSEEEVTLYDTVKVKKTGLVEAKTITRHTEGNANTVVTVGTMINLLYPVGSVYITTNNTNPRDLFGIGEWQAYAQGRALVGVGNLQGTNIAGGQEFGKEKHQITEQELPPHNHSLDGVRTKRGGEHDHGQAPNTVLAEGPFEEGVDPISGSAPSGRKGGRVERAGDHDHELQGNTAVKGGGQAMSLYQPSLGIYVWKRIR